MKKILLYLFVFVCFVSCSTHEDVVENPLHNTQVEFNKLKISLQEQELLNQQGISLHEVSWEGTNTSTILAFENRNFMEQFANKQDKLQELIKIQKANLIVTFMDKNIETIAQARTEDDDDEIDSEFLARLMNPDGVLQIGKWLFRIDKRKELVYVLPVEHRQLYRKLIAENPNHPKITVFSTSDEVLTLLEEGVTGTPSNGRTEGLICDEPKASSKNQSAIAKNSSGSRRINVEQKYAKYGILFEAFSEMKLQEKKWWGWARAFGSIEMDVTAGYTERCASIGQINSFQNLYGSNNRTLKHIVYSSGKQLKTCSIYSVYQFTEGYNTYTVSLSF